MVGTELIMPKMTKLLVERSNIYMHTYIYSVHGGQTQKLESEVWAIARLQEGHVNTQ